MAELAKQTDSGLLSLGEITDRETLRRNLEVNAIPQGFQDLEINDYPEFLSRRRALMARSIRNYYDRL